MSEVLRQDITETIDLVAARWDQADTRLLRRAFPLLAEGQPVAVARIAEAAGVNHETVKTALRLGRAQCDASGSVTGLSGFGLVPTGHRLEIDGVVMYCCCALFSHMIPSLVGQTTRIESVDPITRRLVRLTIHPDGISGVDPAQSAATLVVADQAALNRDIGASFCGHIHHFVSQESAQRYALADERRRVIELGDLRRTALYLVSKVWEI